VSVRRKLRPKPTKAKIEVRRIETNQGGETKLPTLNEIEERPLMATIMMRAPT